jgi:hypothetical protein
MMTLTRMLIFAAQLLYSALVLFAQSAVDPSGHWEGTIQAPNMDVAIAIDLARNDKGQLAGTFAQPSEGVKGLPLSTVAIDGRSLHMQLKPGGSGGGTFNGIVSADGKSLAGEFIMSEGGYTVPFALTRTGDAAIPPAPKNAPISKALEGTWKGALEVAGTRMRLVLTLANQPDGTATGTIASPDGTGVDIPIAMTQKASDLTIDVATVGASFVGVLNAAGTELSGTWTQRGSSLPVTFQRDSGK